MEEIERTNAVMICPNQRVGFTQHNPYTIDIDRNNRNCYNCGRFGHLAKNCRNRETGNRTGEGRRLECRNRNNRQMRRIEENEQNNLNGE